MKTFAQIISIIFQPIFIPLMGIVMLLEFTSIGYNFPLKSKLIIYAGVFLLTGVIPGIVVLLGMVFGKISDGFISHRRQRTLPYLLSILSYVGCCYFVFYQGLGLWTSMLMVGATLSLMLIFLINFFWKISAHMAGIGGLCGGVFACALSFQSNPVALICILILISGALGYSRLYLRAHTMGQIGSASLLVRMCPPVVCWGAAVCVYML